MSRAYAKKIVKQYERTLRKAGYPLSALYLFGSHAKKKAHRWSDIDVAVISQRLKQGNDESHFLLWKLRRDVDLRIEPHLFTLKQFHSDEDPLAYEIRRTGIRIV